MTIDIEIIGRPGWDNVVFARVVNTGKIILRTACDLVLDREAPRDVVMGRHLIAGDLRPGKHFGKILARCRRVQDETGLEDPDLILSKVLDSQ